MVEIATPNYLTQKKSNVVLIEKQSLALVSASRLTGLCVEPFKADAVLARRCNLLAERN